jgi:hypothetical protein
VPIGDQLAQTPHEIRCFALVGQFLHHWAALEATLNNAIETAFGLKAIQGVVLTKNIQLRDKIHILRTITDMSVCEPDRTFYTQCLNAIAEFSAHRNMIAHDSFHPDDQGDGVLFVVAKVKSGLKFPDTRWSVADFQRKIAEIDDFDKDMQRLTPLLEQFAL